jgi:hypothetical protein
MPNTQMRFIRILQDECISTKGTYRIVTSIYNLTYRSEVFLDGLLIDAVEEECYYLTYDAKKEEFFKNKYIDAHQSIKKKYCIQEKKIQPKIKKDILQFNLPKLDYIKLSKIFLGLLFSFILLFFINKSIHKTPKDTPLVSFNKKETPVAKTLQNRENISILKTPKLTKIKEDLSPSLIKEKDMFVWAPTENFVIDEGHYFSLSFTNNSNAVVTIELTGRTLKQSPHDEIIQFKDSDIYAKVARGETKIFQIYIEPTYYKQFDKGKYTGTLTFTLNDTKEKTLVTKQFSFEVK